MPRRCYFIHLATQVSNPWAREGFTHPELIKDAGSNRGKLIAAMLTLVRGWIAEGKPTPSKKLTRLGTFSEWVDLAGGILAYAGIDGFLDNLQDMYDQADVDGKAWTLFLETWLAKLGKEPHSTSQLIAAWQQDSEFAETLPDPIASWFADDAKKYSRKIGRTLAKKNGTPFGPNNLRIVQGENTDKKVATFKVTGYTGYTGYDSFQCRGETSESSYEKRGGERPKETTETPETPYSQNGHHADESPANADYNAEERKKSFDDLFAEPEEQESEIHNG